VLQLSVSEVNSFFIANQESTSPSADCCSFEEAVDVKCIGNDGLWKHWEWIYNIAAMEPVGANLSKWSAFSSFSCCCTVRIHWTLR